MTHLLAFLLATGDSALGLGVILPGEVAISGLAAGVGGTTATVALVLAVAGGAVLGDHVGFHVGRRGGARLRESRLVDRVGVHNWDRATALIRRHGLPAVLVSRILPFVRTVTPAVAGASAMSYPGFAVASAVGNLGWASLWVLSGQLARDVVGALAGVLGAGATVWYVAPALVVVVLVADSVGRRLGRRRRRLDAQPGEPEPVRDLVGA